MTLLPSLPRLPIALCLMALAAAASASASQGCGNDVQIASTTSSSTAVATAGSSGQGAGGNGSSGSSGLSSSGATASSGTGGATASSSTGAGGCPAFVPCQNHIYECGDGMDNDGDGLIDAADPDCLGACDNTEGSFYGGIPGQNTAPCWTECYFDQDTGSGNDDCYWSHKCDPHEVPPSYFPESQSGAICAYDPAAPIPGTALTCADLYASQSPACHAYCEPLTPNGCDCFGCCELPAGSGKYVWLGSEENWVGSCDVAHAADPTKCHPCEPVPSCMNLCDPCELCIGKGAVPVGCSAQDQCAPGITPCGLAGQGCCPAGTYCVTGCCQPTAM